MQLPTVIIPVYNAFAESLNCVKTVLKYSPENIAILIIDDASPEGSFSEYLDSNSIQDQRLEIARNDHNLGFVRSCNLGMNRAGKADIILLNSDTEVTPRWVEKLQKAAYSHDRVGTVTPFTNNGVIASIPRFCQDNPIPLGLNPESFAEIVESVSLREYPEIPTCVGFCTYIRRSLLDKVGMFDENNFGLGYGEENDLSCRGENAGFANILDDTTFIYHKGNCSFVDKKNELSKANMQKLLTKHPRYLLNVDAFCRKNPLHSIQTRIQQALIEKWQAQNPYRVLHILHNGPFEKIFHDLGGTEIHVQDLIRNVNAAHWSLVPGKGVLRLTAHMPGYDKTFHFAAAPAVYQELLRREIFPIIHVHHSRGLNYGILVHSLVNNADYLVSIHDYQFVCPRVNLLTPKETHCNGHECVSSCRYNAAFIEGHRFAAKRLFNSAKKVFTFSQSTQNYIRSILKEDFAFTEVPHGIDSAKLRGLEIKRPAKEQPLRIAVLGYIARHKGSALISQLFREQELDDGTPIEWHIIGEFFAHAPHYVKQHGRYTRSKVTEALQKVNPHLVAILSICPETYCLTLDEAWSAGIPVVVSALGAQAERMEVNKAGWVLKDLSKSSFLELISKISSDWDDYLKKREAIGHVKLTSVQQESECYAKNYNDLNSKSCAVPSKQFFDKLSELLILANPKQSLQKRIAVKCINSTVHSLERLRIRHPIQKAVMQFLPGRIIEKLKGMRQLS